MEPIEKMTLAEQSRAYLRRLMVSMELPAYRWMWFNSLFGTMRLITLFVVRGWLVLELTDSPFWVGAAPAMRGLTQIALGLFAGVLLDRVNRKHMLIAVEIGASLTAFVIGFLVLTDQIQLWHILVISAIEGSMMAVRWPALNTMIMQVVGSERVLNASAAQMLGFNLGNIIASAVAGIIIVALGIGQGYLFAGVCGLIAMVSILFVEGDFRPKAATSAPIAAIKEGVAYIWESQTLMWLILLGFLMSFLGWSNLTMLPVMARDVLGADASGLGFLTAAGAFGSLISTAIIAGLGNFDNKIKLVQFSGVLTTVGILLFAASSWFPLSIILMALMQAALMSFEVTLTASVLLSTADEMQGRVQGIYTQVFGFTWIGGVFLGAIAEWTNAPIAIALGGVAIGFAIALLWRPLNRIENL